MGKSFTSIDFAIGSIGLILLLVGLLLQAIDSARYALAVVPLTGVGTSVLATVIVNSIISFKNRTIDPEPLEAIAAALSERTKLVRRNHHLFLTFTLKGDAVQLTKKHEYTLYNRGPAKKRLVSMYTDTTSWRHGTEGGFTLISEPNNHQLSGAELARYTKEENGKKYFRKEYGFPAKQGQAFVFFSKEFYRKADRLIWTVEDLAEDFRVTVRNETGVKESFTFKINHHREREILAARIYHCPEAESCEEFQFIFNSEILPYQGFEVMWDLEGPAETA